MIKKCSYCEEDKDEIEFGRDKRTPDGFRHSCKKCENERRISYEESRCSSDPGYAEKRRREARERSARNMEDKKASAKEKYKTDEAFRRKERERMKVWWANLPVEKRRQISRSKKYRIKIEEYERKKNEQDGRCAICGEVPEKPLHYDHDHGTGAFRGFLCGPCNIGLGCFCDNVQRLERAIAYLKKSAHLPDERKMGIV